MKKTIYILLAILLVVTAGIFIWRFFGKPKIEPTGISAPTPDKIKEEVSKTPIPKANQFEVPILMYHYIRNAENEDQLGKNLSVSPANFDAQMKYLNDNGYVSIKVADLADPDLKNISQIINDKKKPVAITFDDGYADAYTNAWPILKKYNFHGTFYIIRNYVGKDDSFYLNQTMIDELARSGNEIGSHTLSHPDLRKILESSARKQIFESKLDATTFCYPAGRYNDTTVSLVKEAGYTTAVTTKFGIATEKSNLLELRRVRIENVDVTDFADKISAAWDQTPQDEKH